MPRVLSHSYLCSMYIGLVADIYQWKPFFGNMIHWGWHAQIVIHSAKSSMPAICWGLMKGLRNVHCAHTKHSYTHNIDSLYHIDRRDSFIFIRLTRLIFTHVNPFLWQNAPSLSSHFINPDSAKARTCTFLVRKIYRKSKHKYIYIQRPIPSHLFVHPHQH